MSIPSEPIDCAIQITNPLGAVVIKTHQQFLDVVFSKISHNSGWVANFLSQNELLVGGNDVTGDVFNFKNFKFQRI